MNTTTIRPPRRDRRGFTLIEVLLVIVILGMLATVLVVTIGGTQDKAKIDLTQAQVHTLAGKIEQYHLDLGQYPEALKGLVERPADEEQAEKWAGPYVQSSQLKDQWGAEYQYEVSQQGDTLPGGAKFKLWSNGPDGQSNTEDDITNLTEDA